MTRRENVNINLELVHLQSSSSIEIETNLFIRKNISRRSITMQSFCNVSLEVKSLHTK